MSQPQLRRRRHPPTPPPSSSPPPPSAMKNTRRRKTKITKKPQIADAPVRKGTPGGSISGSNNASFMLAGHRACWLDSDEPQSKRIKYDAGKEVDFKKDGPRYSESVLRVHKSVVSLVASTGGWQEFCSGTVVDYVDNKTWILTSATLVRKPDTQFEAYKPEEIKIEVVLYNGDTVEGLLEMCNLHYNIAIVAIVYKHSLVLLPAVRLSDLPLHYTLQPRPVMALGRDVDSKGFLVSCGKLVRENSELDCKELLICSCDISEMYDNCRTLPWLRIRGQPLHTVDLDILATMRCKFDMPHSGLLVDKVCDTSTKNYGGIEVGDIISELDGAALYSGAQFTAIFLDKFEAAMDTSNAGTLQAVVHRPTNKTTFVAKLKVQQVACDEPNKSFQNRWMEWKRYGFDEQAAHQTAGFDLEEQRPRLPLPTPPATATDAAAPPPHPPPPTPGSSLAAQPQSLDSDESRKGSVPVRP
nr:unnamed protein product [Digitaria exilis]